MTPTDLDALEAAARAATPSAHSNNPAQWAVAMNQFQAAANPAVILTLLAEHKRMREALEAARTAIESLDEQALGLGWAAPGTGVAFQYPLRDELLSRINAALGAQP